MLLIQMTSGSDTIYVSNEYIDIEHYYDPYVASLAQLRVESRTNHGGFCEPSFGSLDLLPTPFLGNWPPPVSWSIKIMMAVTSEADAQILFEGSAHLNRIERDAIIFDLFGPVYDDTTIDFTYTGTLISLFSSVCSGMGLLLDSANATDTSLSYSEEGELYVIDLLSSIASYLSHRFYVEDGILYLIDCNKDNGDILELTEFDIFPSGYTFPGPVKRIVSTMTDDTVVAIFGTHSYGEDVDISPVCRSSALDVPADLEIIKWLIESPRIELSMPLSLVPKIGQKITITDESLPVTTNIWARVAAVVWDFDNELCVVEGEGEIA